MSLGCGPTVLVPIELFAWIRVSNSESKSTKRIKINEPLTQLSGEILELCSCSTDPYREVSIELLATIG